MDKPSTIDPSRPDERGHESSDALRHSEERFRLLVESSPNALIMADRGGAIKLVNRQAEVLFGYDRTELIGMSVDMLLPEPLRRSHPALRGEFFEEPTQRHMGVGRDLYARRKDGFEVPVEIGLTPVLMPEGLFVLATVTDITQRKLAEEALRQSEERFRTLAEAVPQIVWSATAEGIIDYTNRRWHEYTGLATDSPERWDWARVVHPDDLAAAREVWHRVLPAGEPTETEHRLRRADGAYRWHLHRWWPLRRADGQVLKWVGTATDVDDLKRAQVHLEHLAKELRRSNRDLEQFASMVSHDLQQPLVVISGYLKLLKRKAGAQIDGETREYLDIASESAQHMQDMIRGMLDYARVGRSEKPLESVDLENVLDKVLHTLHDEIKQSSTTLTHDRLPSVWGDQMQLELVLQNLLGNAIKFRSTDRKPTIHVGVRREADRWLICVQDNGIGIDADHNERIFEVFQQSHAEGKYPGAGLGLAICKKIVERHGGRIWANSKPGEGSTFYFTIADRPARQMAGLGFE